MKLRGRIADQVIGDKERFEYAWKHFCLIADQRMKAFHFYIIIVAASAVATMTAFTKKDDLRIILACLCWNLCTAIAFFVADWRSRNLLKIPSEALRDFEDRWDGPKLLSKDSENQKEFGRKLLSFTGVFWSALALQAFASVLVAWSI